MSIAEGRFASVSMIAHNRANYEAFKDQSIAGYHSYKLVLLLHIPGQEEFAQLCTNQKSLFCRSILKGASSLALLL